MSHMIYQLSYPRKVFLIMFLAFWIHVNVFNNFTLNSLVYFLSFLSKLLLFIIFYYDKTLIDSFFQTLEHWRFQFSKPWITYINLKIYLLFNFFFLNFLFIYLFFVCIERESKKILWIIYLFFEMCKKGHTFIFKRLGMSHKFCNLYKTTIF